MSNFGDGVLALALPWLASLITCNPMLTAFAAFATRLLWLLCATPAGLMSDRYDRKSLMVVADIVRMILSTGLVVCAVSIAQLVAEGEAFSVILIVSGLAFFLLGLTELVRY